MINPGSGKIGVFYQTYKEDYFKAQIEGITAARHQLKVSALYIRHLVRKLLKVLNFSSEEFSDGEWQS